MTNTNTNPDDIDFTLRQETMQAGLVTRMYRSQNSIFVEVSLPKSPESNDRIMCSFFLTVTAGKLHEAAETVRERRLRKN